MRSQSAHRSNLAIGRVIRRLRKLVESQALGNGPFRVPAKDRHWRLDKRETSNRMRLRMKPTLLCNNHDSAAQTSSCSALDDSSTTSVQAHPQDNRAPQAEDDESSATPVFNDKMCALRDVARHASVVAASHSSDQRPFLADEDTVEDSDDELNKGQDLLERADDASARDKRERLGGEEVDAKAMTPVSGATRRMEAASS